MHKFNQADVTSDQLCSLTQSVHFEYDIEHRFDCLRFHLRMLLILFNRSNVILSVTTIGQCEKSSCCDHLDVLFCRLLAEMHIFLFHEQKQQKEIAASNK
ncbi:hypothetical protein T01_5805 [Trichinella spiralis]|uniref:Uncharacterized protein n=1 Tax=Trichinella spiralis TaxID=6334 RepID=A0A0V1B0M4_TRISP|nr:hypothetical protein T01_5805 [Trichinella spiralis]